MNCPDCGVAAGKKHVSGCDIERCPNCGDQIISCGCDEIEIKKLKPLPWTGDWPGFAECVEFGWFVKKGEPVVPGALFSWVPCSKTDPERWPDLNKLNAEAVWDKEKRRFVKQ